MSRAINVYGKSIKLFSLYPQNIKKNINDVINKPIFSAFNFFSGIQVEHFPFDCYSIELITFSL